MCTTVSIFTLLIVFGFCIVGSKVVQEMLSAVDRDGVRLRKQHRLVRRVYRSKVYLISVITRSYL